MLDELLTFYWTKHYTVSEITSVLGIKHGIFYSTRHVQRLLRKLALKRRANSSPLDDIINGIEQELASGSGHVVGIRPMQYRLLKKYGITVSRQTVGDILKILTPGAVQIRQTGRLTRRVYSVRGPNHIWHCDGYDKLKPFGICIHGAIDGWSRKLIWLTVGPTNNNPNVIGTYYLRVVRELGLVPRVLRLDAGTENVIMADIHRLFREFHDDEFVRNCVIVGKSVHNERIERFWSYMASAYTRTCANLFKDMRDSGILNVSNNLHIECLRFCFIPVIDKDLKLVMDTWNDHRIRKQATYCPGGRPSYLFDCSVLWGSPDMSKPVDLNLLDRVDEITQIDLPVMGAADEFSELALEIMLLNELPLPSTLHDAVDTFDALVELMGL